MVEVLPGESLVELPGQGPGPVLLIVEG